MNPGIYTTRVSLNLYELDATKNPGDLETRLLELGTQAASGRYLNVLTGPPIKIRKHELIRVQLCEDGYVGFLKSGEYLKKVLKRKPYRRKRALGRAEIEKAIPEVLAFLFEAMQTPNRYLWGGTIGPNFDCSGFVQAAYASQGIWLPRDAKEQCADQCTQSVKDDEVQAGDLVFFSRSDAIDHVGIHLGNGFYIHSSGVEFGRDGIGIDRLSKKAVGAGANYFPIRDDSRRVWSSLVPELRS
ncbi:MAG: hypothetical protein V7609_2762 [Verrucomicrobiota bacterium]